MIHRFCYLFLLLLSTNTLHPMIFDPVKIQGYPEEQRIKAATNMLRKACWEKNFEMAQQAIALGALVNDPQRPTNETPLMRALEIKLNLSTEDQTKNGGFVTLPNIALIKALLVAGAKPNDRNSNGQSALTIAHKVSRSTWVRSTKAAHFKEIFALLELYGAVE